MELTSSRAAATIDLQGGRLASLVVDDLELLVTEGAKASRWGSFPMVPWAGRLPFGLLRFDGDAYEFPITSPPHANHGTAMHRLWTQTADDTIQTELAEPWPFGGTVVQKFELTDTAFTVTMTITAADRAMPAQMGWHPWYRRQLDRGEPVELTFAAGQIYETDEEQIPTGNLSEVPEGPWDETFIDVTQTPILTWPGALTVALTSNFDHWVVFTRPDHAYAIEPQSGAPNDINRAPHVLHPGESLSGWMALAWG
jgi:aldose 1-epimerase